MFAEKNVLLEALTSGTPAQVFRSSERALQYGSSLPAIAVDFAPYQVTTASEDGKRFNIKPSYIILLFTEENGGDEEAQEVEAKDLFDTVFRIFVRLYPAFDLFGQPIGTVNFGSGTAFGVAYQLDIGEQTYDYDA